MKAFGETPSCLALPELLEALESNDRQEKQAAEIHLNGCAHCRTELNLFRGFEAGEARPEERQDVDAIVSGLRKRSPAVAEPRWKSFWKPRMWMPAGLATAAALMGLVMLQNRPDRPPLTGTDQVLRSRQIAVIAPMGGEQAEVSKLEWRAVPGAASYRVSLLEADRTPLWTANVRNTEAQVPPLVAAKMTPLKTLLWKVDALDGSGTVLAESGPIRFRMARR